MDKQDLIRFLHKAKVKNIDEIDLSNKDISELPEEIGDLTNVKILNLSYNNLTILPESICNLTNLEKLLLTRNQVSKLPDNIGLLKKLKILDVSYNPIIKLPREIGSLTELENFDAGYCELMSLPLELTNLLSLKKLNLEDNPLEFPPKKVVKRGLYAVMHYLTMEKRKREASKVMMQVFNLPEKIQPAFRQYISYFNEMVSQANHKDVNFEINFINQDFYEEMDLNTGVEIYLYDVMRYIQEKMEVVKSKGEVDKQVADIYIESRINELKSRLSIFNKSLDDKIDEIKKMKNELNGLYNSLEDL